MQEMALPPDTGFVVEWQIADEGPVVDLSSAESEIVVPDPTTAGIDAKFGR